MNFPTHVTSNSKCCDVASSERLNLPETDPETQTQTRFSLRLLARVWRATAERNLDLVAAGVAFYAMLAIFPAIAAIIALWGFVSDPAMVMAQLDLLRGFVPKDAFSLLELQVANLVEANSSTLGWATIVSTAAALWATRAGVAALIRGVNTVYGTAPRSGFWHTLAAIALTLVLIGIALVALISVLVVPVVLAFVPLGPMTGAALWLARWLMVVIVSLTGLSLLYRYGSNHRPDRPLWVSPGTLFALVIWAAASVGFSYYLTNFGSYNQIYGSIGAVIALLMWFYISAYVVLMGAVLNAEISHCLAETNPPGSGEP